MIVIREFHRKPQDGGMQFEIRGECDGQPFHCKMWFDGSSSDCDFEQISGMNLDPAGENFDKYEELLLRVDDINNKIDERNQ